MPDNTAPIDGIIGKILGKLPNDPKVQLQYMYYLNGIIVMTLIGFTFSNIYSFITTWNFSYLFGGILTSVFFLMSLFSFKQTRSAYLNISNQQQSFKEAVSGITPEMIEAELKKRNADYVG